MTGYKLATYQAGNGPHAGIVVGDQVYDAAELTARDSYASVVAMLEDWPNADARIRGAIANPKSKGWKLAETHLRAPLLWPGAIYCAGINYADHAAEMARRQGREPDPDPKAALGKPWHFLKVSRCVADPGAIIAAPPYSNKFDWEVELAAVIGRTASKVSVADALSHVAGYTAANDLSARDLGRRMNMQPTSPFHADWVGQKCFDGACPLGPWIVPASDIPDPQKLALKLWVNDAIKQDSNTSKMIFSLAEQIAHLSAFMTLYPGDVILTGTPAGVGAGRDEFLKPGDVVRLEIEKIGTLTNIIA